MTGLRPRLTLGEVFGPDVIFLGRASWQGDRFLRQGDPSVRDSFTGTTLTVAGTGVPFCSTGVLRASALDLFRAAGVPFTTETVSYASRDEFARRLAETTASGKRIAFQYRYLPDEAPAESYWVPPDLLSFLNDKRNLTLLAPADACPARREMPLAEAADLPLPADGVVVIKGSTWLPSGSGGAVVIARSQDEIRSCTQRLSGCEVVLVEEFLPFTRTMCLHWAVTWTGEIVFLGSADQVVDAGGVFHGSWLGPGFDPPEEAIALGSGVVARARGMGYRGLAGFDMGVLPGGRVIVFDLNFRICASTAPVLWLPLLQARGSVARVGTLTGSAGFEEMCRTAADAARAGVLLPLAAFDPEAAGWLGRPPVVRGLVLGRDRAETEARCEALARNGLAI